MHRPDIIPAKIFSLPGLLKQVNVWKFLGKTIAFTNGCFDILHEGHIYSLSAAAREADMLIVAVNSDASVQKLKGDGRPVNSEHSRALILASLQIVDAVIIFNEDTPLELITQIQPNVLVKGGDYSQDQIAGAGEVISHGGRVVINPVLKGFSTSAIIQKLSER